MTRRKLLAIIHMALAQLGISDEDYRAILEERYGVRSAADLDTPELRALVLHLQMLGWRPQRPAQRPGTHPLLRRIYAQSYSLGRPVPEYATALARRMYGIDRLEWCTPQQLRGISAALACQQRREEVRP